MKSLLRVVACLFFFHANISFAAYSEWDLKITSATIESFCGFDDYCGVSRPATPLSMWGGLEVDSQKNLKLSVDHSVDHYEALNYLDLDAGSIIIIKDDFHSVFFIDSQYMGESHNFELDANNEKILSFSLFLSYESWGTTHLDLIFDGESLNLHQYGDDGFSSWSTRINAQVVPLPAGIYLFLSGLVGLGLMRGRNG